MCLFLLAATAGVVALPAAVRPADEIPMVAIGLPFQPETPTPVAAKHPLYHRVEIGDIEALPSVVKSTSLNFIGAAKRSSVNAAFRDSMERMNLAATTPDAARFRLTAKWVSGGAPFRIGAHNTATVVLHYRLARIDTGRVLFDRDVTTSVDGGGADASMRDNGVVRAAIGANFASVANCLDRAAFGAAPEDCRLTPRYRVSVERR